MTHLIPKSVDQAQKKHAFLAVSNTAISCNDEQMVALILCANSNRTVYFFEAIVHVLNSMRSDSESIINSFNILTRCFELDLEQSKIVFEKSKGLDTLEELQNHQNAEIYKRSH